MGLLYPWIVSWASAPSADGATALRSSTPGTAAVAAATVFPVFAMHWEEESPLRTCSLGSIDDTKAYYTSIQIGINYFRQQGELKGCINDARNIERFLCGILSLASLPDTVFSFHVFREIQLQARRYSGSHRRPTRSALDSHQGQHCKPFLEECVILPHNHSDS